MDGVELKSDKVGWPLLLTVLVLLPGAAVLGPVVFLHLLGFGNAADLGSGAAHVLGWWDSGGRPLCVGAAAFLLLAAARIQVAKAAVLAGVAVACSYAWLYVALFVALSQAGPGALN
jgi:hypothetical protein